MTYSVGWSFQEGQHRSRAPLRDGLQWLAHPGRLLLKPVPCGNIWPAMASVPQLRRRIRVSRRRSRRRTRGQLGAREVVNIPMSKFFFDNTCREFPIFNMRYSRPSSRPLVYEETWRPLPEGEETVATFHQHGHLQRAWRRGDIAGKGLPVSRASWMADNDLAMGRIVEFLSHTPYWKNMAIFVTQDDSGGEPDHVDAQRSVLLVISPVGEAGYVSIVTPRSSACTARFIRSLDSRRLKHV